VNGELTTTQIAIDSQYATGIEAMVKTLVRWHQNGASQEKLRRHAETWLRPYPEEVRRRVWLALFEPWRLRILESENCPNCGSQAYLTTLYGRPMRCMEGRYGGMWEVHCAECTWRGYARAELAQELPRRAMFARR